MSKEYQSIINAAEGGQVAPSQATWDRIAPRLDASDKDSTIKRLSFQKRILGLSACILLGVVIFLSSPYGHHNVYNKQNLSSLDSGTKDIHDNNSVHFMHRIYQYQ